MRDLIGITYDSGSGGPELTAAEWRQNQAGLFTRDTNDLVIGGIRGGAVSNSGFSVTIAPLTVVCHPSASRGVYQAAFPAGATELAKTISAAHASLVRIDAVDVKIFDHEADGSGLRGADIQINAGTPGSGTAPAFTGTGFRLGTFSVPTSGSPVFTANTGLIGYAAEGAALDAASHPANVKPGTLMYNRVTKGLEYYNGTSWFYTATGLLAKNTSGTDILAITTTDPTWADGSLVTPTPAPVVGVTFKAPASGRIDIIPSGHFEHNSGGGFAYVGWELRKGAAIGSGAVVQGPVSDNSVGTGGLGSASTRISASRHCTVSGLDAGDDYNARIMYTTTAPGAGGYDIFYREILVYAA